MENLKLIKLYFYSENKCLIEADPKTNIFSSFVFDIKKNLIIPKTNCLNLGKQISVYFYSYFIGIIEIEKIRYFIFAKNVTYSGKIKNCKIYEVTEIELVSLEREKEYSKKEENNTVNLNNDLKKYIYFSKNAKLPDKNEIENKMGFPEIKKKDLIKNHFEKGFYFSYETNLANSLTKEENTDADFFWNKNLISFLEAHDSLKSWKIPLIKGFFKNYSLKEKPDFFFSILCRIDFKKFIEINVLVENETNLFIKVFYMANIKNYLIDLVEDLTTKFKILIINMICFDGLNSNFFKKYKYFEEEIKYLCEKNTNLKYKFLSQKFYPDFVFNENQMNNYYEEIFKVWEHFMYNKYSKDNFIESKQKGFFFFVYYNDLSFNNLFLIYLLSENFLKNIFISGNENQFSKQFLLQVFAEFFNFLFLHLKDDPNNSFSEVIFKNKINWSVSRDDDIFTEIIFCNQLDFFTQTHKDFLRESLFKNKSFLDKKETISKEISKNKSLEKITVFKEKKKMKVFNFAVLSFNVAGQNPEENFDKSILFSFILKNNPDIIFIALQEIFELKFRLENISYFFDNSKLTKIWRNLFCKYLKDYQLLKSENLKGLLSLIFIKKTLLPLTKIREPNLLKLGLMNLGNKGAIGLKINLFGKDFQFINAHFSAGFGMKKMSHRLFDLDSVLVANKLDCQENHNFVFIAGDLNFKINLKNEKVLSYLSKNKNTYPKIAEFDELFQVLKFHTVMDRFSEIQINFPPTFKYHKNGFLNSKNHTPSWTDRILIKKHPHIKVSEYNSLNINFSDHKPVFLLGSIFI